MKKKVFSKLLMVALVATVGVFSSCKDYDDDITDVRNQIATTKTQLQEDYNSKIATVNSTISGLTQSIANLEKASDAAKAQIEALSTTIDTKFTEAKAYTDAAKGEALTAAEAAKQAAQAYTDQEAAKAQKAAIDAAAAALQAAKDELTAKLAEVSTTLATQGQSISNLIETDTKLQSAIDAAKAKADEAYALADKANTLAEQNKTAVEKAAADIATLQSDLASLKSSAANASDVAKLQSDLAALQKQVNENVVNLADYNTSLTQTTSDLAKLKTDLAKEVDNLTKSISDVKATAEANATKIESINTQLVSLQEADKALETKIVNSVNTLNAAIEKASGDAATALAAAIEGQEAKLAALKTLIENNDKAIRTLLETKASELQKLIDGNTSAISTLSQTVEKNADAQKAENVLMNNAIAKNAQDIVAQGKDITNLTDVVNALSAALGKETAATLKAYAESVAKTAADQALLDAQGYADAQDAAQNITIMKAIAQQAAQDKEAWEKAIDIAVGTLVKTYELASLKETIAAAQTAAEKNAAEKAQEISDNALEAAKHYTDDLKTFLESNYTDTKDMTAAIEAAKKAAIAQAYKDVMDALLADNTDWTKDGKVITIAEEVAKQLKAFAQEAGYTNAEAAQKIAEDAIAAALIPSAAAEVGKPAVEAGPIMAAIEAAAKVAADDLAAVNTALDARLDAIEGFLGATLGDGEAFKASVNGLIAAAKLAKAADLTALQNQVDGYKVPEMQTALNGVVEQANQNASDVQKVMTTINNINAMFTTLFGKSAVESNVDEEELAAFEGNIQSLVEQINSINEVLATFDDQVMASVNKNLGPQIQTMITAIHLFANQHMAFHDQYGSIRKTTEYDGKYTTEYPAGYDNFDHELTFVYAIEQGLFYDYCGTGEAKEKSWNYPDGLLRQLKGISTSRDNKMPNDYDFSYGKGGFTGSETAYDFVEGRFNSREDSILVRVSPTNADLSKADIALLNSLGDDLIDGGLIELVGKPTKYNRLLVGDATRAAEGNETGLWVIKFKLNDNDPEMMEKFNKAAYTNDGDILYAVAVKNTNFTAVDENGNQPEDDGIARYIVSEYDLDLGLEPAKRGNEFFVNSVSINDIHNRYIQPEQSKNGETNWDDDPFFFTGSFRYELTWTDLACKAAEETEPGEAPEEAQADPIKRSWYNFCCACNSYGAQEQPADCYEGRQGRFVGMNEAGYTTILFSEANDSYATGEKNDAIEEGNTVDRFNHDISESGKRQATGVDNRHLKDPLAIEFFTKAEDPTQVPEDAKDGERWAKITIDFPDFNKCGERTTMRGFFVTLDNHFALESDNSEINAWATYQFKNVALYNYDHGKKETDTEVLRDEQITLQEGNHGVIYIKDARNLNDGDVLGFRVHAVNLDGTFTDPDGRAFYVVIGKQNIKHELSFQVVTESNDKYAEAVQDLVNGKNPIAEYNKEQQASKSNDRFFNREPYKPSYLPDETWRAIYVWRGENPAIRATGESTEAWYPVEGTGNGYVAEDGSTKAKATVVGDYTSIKTNAIYGAENFFEFYYSDNEAADTEDKTGDVENNWSGFNTYYNDYKRVAPNKETMSMKARIKKNMANRLLDDQTYHITMIIQRLDGQTDWRTVNTYDIDITKVMPTGMPEQFSVKSKQLAGGAWTIYLRPDGQTVAANGCADDGGAATTSANANNAWKISWGAYADKWFAEGTSATTFANNFDKDLNLNTDPASVVDPTFHNQRWGVDARPYDFEEMFNGLLVETEEGSMESEFDKDYYFIFNGAGDFNAAETYTDKVKGDEEQKDADAIAVWKQNVPVYQNKETLTHAEGGYRLPKIHWSHLGKKVDLTAGYIYRNISAKLDNNSKKFLKPTDPQGDFIGLEIANADLPINPVAVTSDKKQVQVEFKCAFGAAVKVWNYDGKDAKNTFEYNQPIMVGADAALFTLENNKWEEGATASGKIVQAYFDSKLEQLGLKVADKTAAKDITNGVTLAQMLQGEWIWIDKKSLAVNITTPKSGYEVKDYYYAPYFADANGEPVTAEMPQTAIANVGMKPKGATTGNPDYKEAITGTFTFDIYDVWFHKKTITVNFKVNKPEATTARQAR